MKYKAFIGNEIYHRPFRLAVRFWLEYDVLPWFQKLDYCNGQPPHYRWKKLFNKNLCIRPVKKLDI